MTRGLGEVPSWVNQNEPSVKSQDVRQPIDRARAISLGRATIEAEVKTTLRPRWPKVPTVSVVIACATLTIALGSCAPASSTDLTFAGPCAARIVDGAIPSWARGGFSDPNPHMHFEVGRLGKIVCTPVGLPTSFTTTDDPQQQDSLGVAHSDKRLGATDQRAAHDELQAGWPSRGSARRRWSGTLDHRLTSIWLLAARSSVDGST